jgi:hypothetical protein
MTEENFEETQAEETTSQETEELDLEQETVEQVEESKDEDSEFLKEKLAIAEQKAKDLEEKNKQLYARVKKPSKEVKESKDNSEGNIELIEFFAKGNSREDYQRLQVIMKGTGLSMAEAMADPLYQSYKEKKDREARDEKAQIGASKSSSSGIKSDFKPDMTVDEHKEAWKKANSR